MNGNLNAALILIDRALEEIENGFVPCKTCGNQEDTKDLDFVDDIKDAKTELLKVVNTSSRVVTDVQQLMQFSLLHNKDLCIGMKVTVDPANAFVSEWGGEFIVLGIEYSKQYQCINVTIGDDWNCGGTDGWKPEDLIPVNN